MKLIKYFIAVFLSVSFGSHADNMAILQMKNNKKQCNDSTQYTGLIINTNDYKNLDQLLALGVDICFEDANTLIAKAPSHMISTLDSLDWINSLNIPKQAYPTINIARESTGIDYLHKGISINDDIIPFTGKGVIIGIVDAGIDPNHIAFEDRNNDSRVKRYIKTQSSIESGDNTLVAEVYDTPKSISEAIIDRECEGHGTHTAGTAAGGYMGNIYYGVAPDAELVLTSMGSSLYDDEILYGISATLDYAESVNKPVVVNLSLGSALGPHDGTGYVTDYLSDRDKNGEIVCFSAGNDGDDSLSFISLAQDFSKDPTPLSSAFAHRQYWTPAEKIYTQIWSSDNKEHEICFHVIDIYTKSVIYTSEYFNYTNTDGSISQILILVDSASPEDSLLPELHNYFAGTMLIAAEVNNANNRYCTEVLADFENISTDYPYILGFSIKSEQGASVMMIADTSTCFFKSFSVSNFVNGGTTHSISDFCCSPYVVSIGAWNARMQCEDIFGQTHELDEIYFGQHNDIAKYSSYGSVIGDEGNTLPHCIAPGTSVIAPVIEDINNYCDIPITTEHRGEQSYFWGTKTGTSMATPIASGIIALWLEAKPDLTRDQVIEIINKTSKTDTFTENNPNRAGAGKIDAYEGLKYIFTNMSDIDLIYSDEYRQKVILRHIDENKIQLVVNYTNAHGSVKIYKINGEQMLHQNIDSNIIDIEHTLSPGIYIIKVSTDRGNSQLKLLVD